MHNLYHQPTTLPPLQVDSNKVGKDSDHNIVLFAPKNIKKFKNNRNKRVIKTRPLPESKIILFEEKLANQPWEQLFQNKSPDEQADMFHTWLRTNLDCYFPEKSTKFSSLDKKWMSPLLKNIHRNMTREYCINRRSLKYKKLRSKFRKLKRKSVQSFYSNFVHNLKQSHPGKWFKMAKKIGAIESESDKIKVESLSGLTDDECAQKIAEHFATISNEYKRIDCTQLPAYLPSLPPPQVDERDVYLRMKKQSKDDPSY